MVESDLNRIIFSSIRNKSEKNFSEKVSDASPTQKCFDGIACFENTYWNIESKLIKGDFTSFNFNRIETHQLKNLTKIKNQIRETKSVEAVIIVGYFIPRQLFGFFIFDIDTINYLIEKGINSLKQKQMKSLKDKFFINIESIKIAKGKSEKIVEDIQWYTKIIRREDILL